MLNILRTKSEIFILTNKLLVKSFTNQIPCSHQHIYKQSITLSYALWTIEQGRINGLILFFQNYIITGFVYLVFQKWEQNCSNVVS